MNESHFLLLNTVISQYQHLKTLYFIRHACTYARFVCIFIAGTLYLCRRLCSAILTPLSYQMTSTEAALTSLPFRWRNKTQRGHLWASLGGEKKKKKKKRKQWREKKVKESKMKWDDSRCSEKGHAVMHHSVKMGEWERVWCRESEESKEKARGWEKGDGCRMQWQMKAAPVNTLKCNMVQVPEGGVASSRCSAKHCCLNFIQGGQTLSGVQTSLQPAPPPPTTHTNT